MEINILSLSDGAKIAKGITVIIDVYRAFTTQSFAFENGVKDILNVSDIEHALDMKENGFGDFCMGEIGGIRPDNFDFGNSPYDLKGQNIKDKTISLSKNESHHCINVFRNNIGDNISVLDGNGNEYICEIIDFHNKEAKVEIIKTKTFSKNSRYLHLIISPTKSKDYLLSNLPCEKLSCSNS